MKILNIRFQNLNSLLGEWNIDLQRFSSQGIFTITGPTGAGKTTILDAICLALYGRTPRLNKITKLNNEMMSRQAGECFSEVIFEVKSKAYRCHWSQRRARKKAGAELQSPKHELSDAHTGEILETKFKAVGEEIERLTGMDFDRFTRSMLLAQGGFASFLNANPDERAPILEQITGTQIYSDISIRVHERQRFERERLNALQAKIDASACYSNEAFLALQQTIEAQSLALQQLKQAHSTLQNTISWRREIEALTHEEIKLNIKIDKLNQDIIDFSEDRERLNFAQKARQLEPEFAKLETLRYALNHDVGALQNLEPELIQLERALSIKKMCWHSAMQQTQSVRTAYAEAQPMLNALRALEQHLEMLQNQLQTAKNIEIQEQAACQAQKNALNELKSRQNMLKQAYEALMISQEEFEKEREFVQHFSALQYQFESFFSQKNQCVKLNEDVHQAQKKWAQAQHFLTDCCVHSENIEHNVAMQSQRLSQAQQRLTDHLDGRLLREYRAQKEQILREMMFVQKIAALETHREQLESGKPCPLCGATEHPFFDEQLPKIDTLNEQLKVLSQHIEHAEQQESVIKIAENELKILQNRLNEANKHVMSAHYAAEQAREFLAQCQVQHERAQTISDELAQTIVDALALFQIFPSSLTPKLLDELHERKTTYLTRIEQQKILEKQQAELDLEQTKLRTQFEAQAQRLHEAQEYISDLTQEIHQKLTARTQQFGECSSKQEVEKFESAMDRALQNEKHAHQEFSMIQNDFTRAQSQKESLQSRITPLQSKILQYEQQFLTTLRAQSFSDERAFLNARCSYDVLLNLSQRAQTLEDTNRWLAQEKITVQEKLKKLNNQMLSEDSLEILLNQLSKLEHEVHEKTQTLVALQHEFSTQQKLMLEQCEVKKSIAAQQIVFDKWNALYALIGSADGKKFRNFAQGLTFELMIAYANQQLRKMTDRYLLLHDSKMALELSVIDLYQAGEIRSTKNLSGGESFLMSLALALGLSSMLSQHVRVDSLFLDEGFGTLDQEALENTLETLANLRHEGKLIGIISHIPALNSRIPSQIHVIPKTNGVSTLKLVI